MSIKFIQSRENPLFKECSKLAQHARQRHKSGLTLLDGVHLLKAYLDAGHTPQQVLVNTAALADSEVQGVLKRVDSCVQLDDKLFDELTELKTPTGVLTLIAIPRPVHISAQFALLLEDIQDPGNLGSILRSAAAAGCDAVYLSPACADAWSPKVLRAAMGGHFVLPIYERQNLHNVAQQFKGALLATSLQASQNLYHCDLNGAVAFMLGNEGAGLSPELQSLASKRIFIPMLGKVESLNVAAAAAVCLFEVVRRKSI